MESQAKIQKLYQPSHHENEKDRQKRKILYGSRASSKIFESSSMPMSGTSISKSKVKKDHHLHDHQPQSWKERLIISSENKQKAIFDVFILFLVGYSCVTCVFYAAFSEATHETVIQFDFAIEFVFGFDLLLNFFQSYLDVDTNIEIREFKKIARNYIFHGWFFVDFISVFPFQILFRSQGEKTKLFRLFRLPRLIKLIDISRFN